MDSWAKRRHFQSFRGPTVSGLLGAIAGCWLLASCSTPQAVDSTPAASTPTVTESAPALDAKTLRLLYTRIPASLNPHLATGFQDFEVARIVYEPLASYNAAGDLVPLLAAEIPSLDNGGVAADGLSVTWKLRQNVAWSDGEPLTAADIVFTYEFVQNPEVAAATAQFYQGIKSVEAIDDYTVKISFERPNPAWSIPFTGQNGVILPQHVFADYNGLKAREAPANFDPIGTGPYQVESFESGHLIFQRNPNYWGEQPYFEQVEIFGGIAPYAAARAVLKTGEADFAHNLQVEAETLAELEAEGAGKVVTTFGSSVERIMLNPTDPNQETETGERSSVDNPHPFLSDRQVRQAINYAIDRQMIAEELYGKTGQPTAQLLVAPSPYVSERISAEYDLNRAAALLEEAGWSDTNDNGTRDKDGVEMNVVFQTSVNPVRQKTQAIIKANLEAIGIGVEIKRVRVDDFFSADPAQTDSINHFYADLQAYNIGNDSPDPEVYMSWWVCDEIASQANNWQEPNNARYCNPEYDALWQAASQELDPQRRAELFQQMDELLAQDVAVIPVVRRAIANGVSQTLVGLNPTPWDTSTWDIARWRRADAAETAEPAPTESRPASPETPQEAES
ncbi:peptide ABC transporter substrate-binding protein [Almyronema epifaneia]|uniref:Peptide ABC transporter substrate-binding protein n=1 Tax=Almyronema epifaneia S1 TaxID=2991925 RepID=A0ABW6IBD7_9CYAN